MKNLATLAFLSILLSCPLRAAQPSISNNTSSTTSSLPSTSHVTVEPGSEYTVIRTQDLARIIEQLENVEALKNKMESLEKNNKKKERLQKEKRAQQRKDNKIMLLRTKLENQPNCLTKGISSVFCLGVGATALKYTLRNEMKKKVVKDVIINGVQKEVTTQVFTKSAYVAGAGTMAIGAGLTFGCLAYNGHCQNKKEQEYIEKQIKFIQELPICVKITEGGFMSDSEEEEESKEDE